MPDSTVEFLEITGKTGDPSAPLTLHKRAGSSKPIKIVADDGGVTTFDPSDVVMADGWDQSGSPADVDTNGGAITGLPTPAADADAATKKYVDDTVGSAVGAVGLAEVLAVGADAGGTTVTGLGDPSADADASTKKYVDDSVAGIPLVAATVAANVDPTSVTFAADLVSSLIAAGLMAAPA